MPMISLYILICCIFISLSRPCHGDAFDDDKDISGRKLPIIYVYTLVKNSEGCHVALPDYILITLSQALMTQGDDAEVIFAANYRDCKGAIKSMRDSDLTSKGLIMVDIDEIASDETKAYVRGVDSMLNYLKIGEWLYAHSMTRFMYLQDLMKVRKYTHIMHVEADNMLYGKLSNLVSALASSERYSRGLAATPLTWDGCLITASVLWVPSLEAMEHFTGFLSTLVSHFFELDYHHVYVDAVLDAAPAHRTSAEVERWGKKKPQPYTAPHLQYFNASTGENLFTKYIETRGRKCGCCKDWGLFSESSGSHGIKPHFVNEMSMLGFYQQEHPHHLLNFPVLPSGHFVTNRYVQNMSMFSPMGTHVGGPTLDGVWDPNSWGQRLGGTSKGRGNNIGFLDPAHIVAQGIMVTMCGVRMRCSNPHMIHTIRSLSLMETSVMPMTTALDTQTGNTTSTCWTQPFVTCGKGRFAPLWNLHVHSKLSAGFVSRACPCTPRARVRRGADNVTTPTLLAPDT